MIIGSGPRVCAIPGNHQTIVSELFYVGSGGERTSQPMFCFSRELIKSFSGRFLVSISLFQMNREYLIKILMFNSLAFK